MRAEPNPQRMRILFLASVPQLGLGGHYHSLAAIAGALIGSGTVDGSIVTVGRNEAPALAALASEGIRVRHLPFGGANPAQAWRALREECRLLRPDVVHAFDEHAFLFARLAARKFGIGAVVTKCGGPPPPKYFPRAEALTVFSQEDRDWFTRHGWPAVFLLPNRVRSVPQDEALCTELARRFTARTRILRISRIVGHYEKTMADSIRLVSRLRAAGFDVELMILGRVYDPAVLRRLQSMGGDAVVWVTDERFTSDPKRLIDVAELVVGTGRSLMEAVARGRTVLCPVAGLLIPCLVTPANVEALAHANFSERGRLDTTDDQQFELLCERLRAGRTEEETRFLASLSARFCDIDAVLPKYAEIYRSRQRRPDRTGPDLLLHGMKVVYVFLRQRWRDLRRRAS